MEAALRTLARFASGLRAEEIPEEVLFAAAQRVQDNVSVGIAGASQSLIRRICQAYRATAEKEDGAAVWGQDFRAPLSIAAFLNALACHVLELDDVHSGSKAHIGTVVIPAAWSMAENLGSSGRELLTAVVAGYELEARIGMAFDVKSHRSLGWHVTATAGVFGAAAACGSLMGFDEERMLSCLALAGAQSFGTWAFLSKGCNSKILNPARASANGCEAALLSAAGMNGPETILSARDGGLLHMMSDCPRPELLTGDLGSVWEVARVDSKPYPCCRSTHCVIDSVLQLRTEESLRPEDVEHIRISTYKIGYQQCGSTPSSLRPSSPVEASFSIPYCAAAALLCGKVTMDEFLPEKIADPELRRLVERIEVEEQDRFTAAYPQHWGCHVQVLCRDGRILEGETVDASGSINRPLSVAQALARAEDMIARTAPEQAAALASQLLDLRFLTRLPALQFLDKSAPVCNHIKNSTHSGKT